MILSTRRVAAFVSAITLGVGATAALGTASSGASSPVAAVTTPGIGVNGLCGNAAVAAIPTNLTAGHSESSLLRVFTEQVNFALTQSLPYDASQDGLYSKPSQLPTPKPRLATGTHVNSYLLHMDPPGTSTDFVSATVGFNADVLGVQFISPTLTSSASAQVHPSGVVYPSGGSGLELVAAGTKDSVRIIGKRTVAVRFKTSPVTDDVRVITRSTTTTATGRTGYRMLAADGGVFDFGGQQFFGSTGNIRLVKPVVAGVNTCGNAGYWFVASDGGVFSYGDAIFHGSLGGLVQPAPVVAMTSTPTGFGYYLAEANGKVPAHTDPTHAFGDAGLFTDGHGHTDASFLTLTKPIVGMATTATGLGYWLVASDGGIFSFGDAAFFGSTGALHLVSPIVGMTVTKTGHGYYLYAADGGIFAYGDAAFHGSVGGSVRSHPVVGMRLSPTGNGYWFDDSAGTIFHFGDAQFAGDMSTVTLARPMIGMM